MGKSNGSKQYRSIEYYGFSACHEVLDGVTFSPLVQSPQAMSLGPVTISRAAGMLECDFSQRLFLLFFVNIS